MFSDLKADGRNRPVARRAGRGAWRHDLLPLPLLIMVMSCNVSAAMMLANPFVTASMLMVLDGSSATRSHLDA